MSLLSLLNCGEFPYDIGTDLLGPEQEVKLVQRPPISIKVPPPPNLDITAQSSPASDVATYEIPADAVPQAVETIDVRPTAATSGKAPNKKKKSHARKQPEGHIARPRNAFILFRKHVTDNNLIPATVEVKHQNISLIASKMWKEAPPDVKSRFVEAARLEKEEHARKYPNYRYQPAYKRADIVRRRVRKDVNEDNKCDAVAALLIKGKAGAGLEQEVKRELAKRQPDSPKDLHEIQLITKRGRRRRKDAPGELSKGALRAERAAARARQMRQQWMDTSLLLPAHQRAQLEEIARQQHQQHPTYMLDVPEVGEVQYQLWEDENGVQFWAPVEQLQEAFEAEDFQDFQMPYLDQQPQQQYYHDYQQPFDTGYQSGYAAPSGLDGGVYSEQPTQTYYAEPAYPQADYQQVDQYQPEQQLFQPYSPYEAHEEIQQRYPVALPRQDSLQYQPALDAPQEPVVGIFDPALMDPERSNVVESLPLFETELLPTHDIDFGAAGELFGGELNTQVHAEGGRPWEL